MNRVRWIVVCLALAATSLATRPAHAADEATKQALEHFRRGTKAYDLGHFLEAAQEYEKAYEARESPALLYNLGQAYRGAGEYQKALLAYRSYLRRLPEAANRNEVVAFIEQLKKQIEEQKRLAEKPQPAPPEPVHEVKPTPPPPVVVVTPPPPKGPSPEELAVQRRSGRRLKLIGIGGAALGGALVVTGAVLSGLALKANDRLNHPSANEPYKPSLQNDVLTYQNSGIALLAVGGAIAVTGAALAVLGYRHEKAARFAFAPVVGNGQLAASMRVTF